MVSAAYAVNKKPISIASAQNQDQAKGSSRSKTSEPPTKGRPKTSVTGNQKLVSKDCNATSPAHPNLDKSYVPELRKLAEYEKVCGGSVAGRTMVFLGMPASNTEAVSLAKDATYTLQEMANYKISPLVILEPQTSQGFINYASCKTSGYAQTMDTYFATLKIQGITSDMMGMWVPFPESNIPEWGNTKPTEVAACITKTVQLQKKHFPASQASVLLDSKTYPNGNSWDGGKYSSLVPYVKDIPKGLIDSFGLQGYPWPDVPADYNAAHFVNPDLAIEAAHALGVSNVWLSTGTFAKGKAWNGQVIVLNTLERQAILNDILKQALKIQDNGFKTSLNLFAENKYNTGEHIDWSYWPSGKMAASPAADVFKTLVNDLQANNIDLWLFDSTTTD